MTLNDRIRQRRIELGLSQSDLAIMLGYNSRSSINKIELGQRDLPQRKIVAFAKALQVTPGYLMGWDSEAKPTNIIPLETIKMRPLLGTIACGTPILAQQNIDRYMPVPDEIRCDFLLRCQGDSMIDAGISDGDLVYLKSQEDVDDGDIAAVLINGTDTEATLKRVYRHDGQLTLMPANTAYPPIVLIGEEINNARIIGKAVAVTRRI